jgi:hypothetical protein
MPHALVFLIAIAMPLVGTQSNRTILATLKPAVIASTCHDTTVAQSAWKEMLQSADARLCTATVVPQ